MAVMFSSAFLFFPHIFTDSAFFTQQKGENYFSELLRSQVLFGSPRAWLSLGYRNEVAFFCCFTKFSRKVKTLDLESFSFLCYPPNIILCAFLSTQIRKIIFGSLIWTISPDFTLKALIMLIRYQLHVEDIIFKAFWFTFQILPHLREVKIIIFFFLWLYYSRLRKAWFIKVLNVEGVKELLC